MAVLVLCPSSLRPPRILMGIPPRGPFPLPPSRHLLLFPPGLRTTNIELERSVQYEEVGMFGMEVGKKVGMGERVRG